MSKEYYIPTIEEFHIGFECEANYNNKMMIPITMQGVGQEVVDYHKQNVYRVKYLDKEDIESLGFTVAKNDPYWYDYKNSRFYLYKDNPISKYWTISDEESQFGFTGSIKNISELKVLLKQLNIHD